MEEHVQNAEVIEDVSRETSEQESVAQEATSQEQVSEEPKKEYTEAEKQEIERFMSKLNLPKGVEYFQDKDGSLKFIVPINGKKFIATPEDVFKGFNINQAGYQKLNEGKNLTDQVRGMFEQIKQNPRQLFELAHRLGVDPRELAAQYLQEIVEEEELSPSEKEARNAKREAETYKKELERLRLEREQQILDAQVAEERERYDKELVDAMKEHGFERSNTKTKSYILSSAVGKLLLAVQNGRTLTPSDAVYLAKQDWHDFVQGVYGELDPERILQVTPPHIIDAIRKADQRSLQSKPVIPTSSAQLGQEISLQELPQTKGKKPKTINEFFERL